MRDALTLLDQVVADGPAARSPRTAVARPRSASPLASSSSSGRAAIQRARSGPGLRSLGRAVDAARTCRSWPRSSWPPAESPPCSRRSRADRPVEATEEEVALYREQAARWRRRSPALLPPVLEATGPDAAERLSPRPSRGRSWRRCAPFRPRSICGVHRGRARSREVPAMRGSLRRRWVGPRPFRARRRPRRRRSRAARRPRRRHRHARAAARPSEATRARPRAGGPGPKARLSRHRFLPRGAEHSPPKAPITSESGGGAFGAAAACGDRRRVRD